VPVYDKSKMATKADLEKLAAELNPLVKFWDPLNLAEAEFWGDSNQATIGWLRQAEIKHGRVAMFAFVGYCVQANGYHWPWPMTLSGDSFPAMSSPPEQWDAIPEAAKWQIMLTVAFLEGWDESQRAVHYMRGGQPGAFPPLTGPNSAMPHSVPFDLFDPFGLSKNRSAEAKARGLKAELNNGRLAQIGIFGFLAEAKVEGSVPALSGLGIQHYSGDFMGLRGGLPHHARARVERPLHPVKRDKKNRWNSRGGFWATFFPLRTAAFSTFASRWNRSRGLWAAHKCAKRAEIGLAVLCLLLLLFCARFG